MANLLCVFDGVRGRVLKLYDTKCVITTHTTVGSLMTGNFTDGEKTIFLSDVVGVQFKKSGSLIGFLQFETPSIQINNQDHNMFSENTFTFIEGTNGITNDLMELVYNYVTDRIEELKYGVEIIKNVPNFNELKAYSQAAQNQFVDTAKEEDESEYFAKWKQAQEIQAKKIGTCELCGNKNQELLFVEFEDFFGRAKKHICYTCFCKKEGTPIDE